ncbi:MAG: hypothetical protein LR005_02445 [Candidatus Pacebacteria bacterium]|nr:hypothetical protein [Candidatus Paceibacterota bacterium]
MNSIRKFYFIFIVFLLVPIFSSALSASFTTLPPVDVEENNAYVRGEFNARDEDLSNAFYVWFQYGKSPDKLFSRTREVRLRVKNSIQSQQLTDLDAEMHYYYRTVLKDGADLRYGHVLDFVTLQKSIENTTSSDEPKELFDHKPFSFYEILKWRKKKEKVVEQPAMEIEQNTEIEFINKDKSIDKNVSGKHYNNSAAYDDELGEVIEFNKKNTTFKNKKNRETLNYPILLFLIVLLGVALVLIRLILLKKKRKKQYQSPHQRVDTNRGQGRYYIPVERDLHDPKQNPNRFFTEKNNRDK